MIYKWTTVHSCYSFKLSKGRWVHPASHRKSVRPCSWRWRGRRGLWRCMFSMQCLRRAAVWWPMGQHGAPLETGNAPWEMGLFSFLSIGNTEWPGKVAGLTRPCLICKSLQVLHCLTAGFGSVFVSLPEPTLWLQRWGTSAAQFVEFQHCVDVLGPMAFSVWSPKPWVSPRCG